MRCCGLLVSVLVGVLVTAGCGDADTAAEIDRAARAPYVAVVARDASALCADFTPAVARRLARRGSRSASCDERVAEVFARSAPFEPKPLPVVPSAFQVNRVTQHGNVASAAVTYGVDGSGVRVTLGLARIGGDWRVSTRPTLRLVSGCYVGGVLTERCLKDARVMLFSIGKLDMRSEPGGGVNAQRLVPVPPAVEDAGGSVLNEFKVGMKVVAQSGCLACHRIGEQGNSGPGPNLTHIGSTLSDRQIEHAILDPTAPMPSFKNFPDAKLKDVVEFLAQLH